MKAKTPHDTPMMRQYLSLKSQVPDALLFYRMGDFYELFFEDAERAAGLLELTLTSRNSKDPNPIPMCGVPHHAADGYLRRLVQEGVKVAIAEQVETPGDGKRTLMERELVRVVTPGVPYDSDQLEARESCFLLGLVGPGPWGLAFLDVSTGELRLTETESLDLALREINRLEPREAVLPQSLEDHPRLAPALEGISLSHVEDTWFDVDAARLNLNQVLGTHDLAGFGAQDLGCSLGSAGALITYVRETARVSLDHVQQLRPYTVEGHMVIDQTTRTNLELFRPLRGRGRKGTLIHLMDRTCTPMGGRCLRDWLSHPLVDPGAIGARQDAVESLMDSRLRMDLRAGLKEVSDLERLGAKAAQGVANGRDLRALCVSLQALPRVVTALADLVPFQDSIPSDLMVDVRSQIDRVLVSEPPVSLTEGNIIARGVDADLDELVSLSTEGKTAIAAIESREREATGISSLKVKHNKVFGYFLEVTQSNLGKVPEEWHRKQTLANAERFITPELKEFEEKVLGADEKRKALEYELFRQLRDDVAGHITRLQDLARWVAMIDTLASLADLASDKRYIRPLVHSGARIELQGCRHPVVEAEALDEPFVPNDILLDENRRLVILTGPNMAGKSTVMRQLALCVLMAQVGGFVPADKAEIGVADRLFVRVGASDDLAKGRSTFMVEMSETALILNQATSQSLVLLDEIGRGTSTLDGLSIAWAVAEAVHDRIQARTIFATHYHELVHLADGRVGAVNMHVGVREWGERIVFLRTLKPGGASKSYGIQCARLAGMPSIVVERAGRLLRDLERERARGQGPQLSLFGVDPSSAHEDTEAEAAPSEVNAIAEALDQLDPDSMSPRDALEALYKLKELTE
jgi:DNA mismatch repair protein MutS